MVKHKECHDKLVEAQRALLLAIEALVEASELAPRPIEDDVEEAYQATTEAWSLVEQLLM